MSAQIGIVTFPGSLDDIDAARAVMNAGGQAVQLWHNDRQLSSVDAVIIPGGFSYGDYLRAGAIAKLAPIMETIIAAAKTGMPVLGICNGFQILCEAGLLPGALTLNTDLKFNCSDQWLAVNRIDTAWSGRYLVGAEILIPAKNTSGRYVADAITLQELETQKRIVFRYLENPNGSDNNIAGICNTGGNVVGMMPHPEHAIDVLTGPSIDGQGIFLSILDKIT